MREHPDASGAFADLVQRGLPPDVARVEVQRLAGADKLVRMGIAARLFLALSPQPVLVRDLADDVGRWLRQYGYLPEPTRCRWCGGELTARSHVAVMVDGIACARCALRRGVS